MGLFSSKKPRPIPAFFKTAAKHSQEDYGQLRELWQQLQPKIAQYAQQYQDTIPKILEKQDSYIRELDSLQARANRLGSTGQNLERQTLKEIGQTGSQQRQDDFAIRSNERFSENLKRQRMAQDTSAAQRGVKRTFSSAAEQAAASTVAENEARRAEQYRGEDVRRQNLANFGQLAQQPAMHQANTANAYGDIANTHSNAARGFTAINSLNSDFYNNQVSPAFGQAQSGAANLYDAQLRYDEAKAAHKTAKFSNIGKAIGATAGFIVGGPAGAAAGAQFGGQIGGYAGGGQQQQQQQGGQQNGGFVSQQYNPYPFGQNNQQSAFRAPVEQSYPIPRSSWQGGGGTAGPPQGFYPPGFYQG